MGTSKSHRQVDLESLLRCPYSGLPLNMGENEAHSAAQSYPMINGILSLVHDKKLAAIDELFQQQYGEKTAKIYDKVLRLQSALIGCWEPSQRRSLVGLLDPPLGGHVLEVAVGTGANLPFLAKSVGSAGMITGVDLSLEMLKMAQKRANTMGVPVSFIRADGCHLPFVDDCFDAVFHFGGINMFGDVKRGIEEMVRVAKPGAPLIIGDESMSEKRRRTWFGKRLGKINTLYLCRVPYDKMPWGNIHGFELHWAWRELFYVLRFRKGALPSNLETTTVREQVHRRLGL